MIMTFAKSRRQGALLLIMALAGFLSFYAIGQEGYGNQYYAAAVKSMLTNRHSFFYASFDSAGYVTVDKPALGLWLQALSAAIFGFHGWSLILPEALSAVISVALTYHLVQRFAGKAAGLVSALILALTPILIAVSRTNNLDSSLIMVLLLAAWAMVVAAERGSFKLLLLSVALVGLGFNIKMLQAFMVLPGLYLVYLGTAPVRVGKRIGQLAAATTVLLVVSLSWAVVVDLTPAEQRPYIGSSKTNSVIELALGYNGLQRLTGRGSDGFPGLNGQTQSPAGDTNSWGTAIRITADKPSQIRLERIGKTASEIFRIEISLRWMAIGLAVSTVCPLEIAIRGKA
jgi:4-amino-4-deoxy-L-arabinose transferase-like glycosyltransferase